MLLLEIAAQLQQKQIKNNADKIDDVTPFSSSSTSFTCFCITKPLQLQQQQQKISWVFRLKHSCHLRMRFSPPLPTKEPGFCGNCRSMFPSIEACFLSLFYFGLFFFSNFRKYPRH